MKISFYDLEALGEVHKFVLENKGRGLIDKVSNKVNLSKNEILRILKRLEKLGIIKDLKVNSRVFNCTIVEQDMINGTVLMKKYDFILTKEPQENDKDVKIRELKEENEKLREENESLRWDIKMLKKFGKSFKEKLDEVKVVSGD